MPKQKISRTPTPRRGLAPNGEPNGSNGQRRRALCIHELFERKAEQAPRALAVTCEGARLSYGELNRRANQLARHLQSKGVVAEARVAICMERSLELIVGILAILKAGAAYVPLDPNYPPDRLSYMMNDAGIRVLLADNKVRDTLEEQVNVELICPESDADAIARHKSSNLHTRIAGDNAAYVIY